MKRTIIQQGAGYTVTLPVEWVRKFNLDKGNEVDVSVRGKTLVIKHDKDARVESLKLRLNSNKNQIISHIVSAYIKGADELCLSFDNPEIKDRHGEIHKTAKIVHGTVNSLIGFSVVEQKQGSFLIKDIAKTDRESFDIILRRLFLLLMNVSEESLKAIERKDRDSLEEIALMYENIRQFVNYALRLLNKHEYSDSRKTANMYAIACHLLDIADAFRHMAKHYSKSGIKITKGISRLHKDLHESLRAMYELFYDLNDAKLERYFELRDRLYVDYRKFKDAGNADGILENISYIRQMSTDIVRERMGM